MPLTSSDRPLSLIAIGASAGGLEALQDFLSHLPESLENISIIVAQHLSPTHKSMLVGLLSRKTDLEVAEAKNGTELEVNKVYITPPDSEITVSNGKIRLAKPPATAGPKPSVDVLFHSLAEDDKSAKHVVGVILSGTGTDGASGVQALRNAGGFIIAQEPHTAKYSGMPVAAIQTESVDVVLSPDKMGDEILEYTMNPNHVRVQKELEKNEGNSLDKIFELLSKRTGTDFSNYKSATIGRRLQKRLSQLKIKSIEDYVEFIEKNPGELDEMFRIILIGVTGFFRDTNAFKALEKQLRKIAEGKTNKDPIRIWVPGCSTGEEAYTIAILLSQILKNRVQDYNIQIFATDVDDKAISIARKGIYSKKALESISEEIQDYFVKKEDRFELIKPIRSMVLFSKHDVTSNPPFLKLDLISCRNLLIYFGAGLQQQIIPIFHYALNPDGILFLGKSETVGHFTNLFSTIDGKNKLFRRKRNPNVNPINFSAFKALRQEHSEIVKKKKIKELSVTDLVKATLFNTYEHPYVVIDSEYIVRETYGDVRLFMTLPTGTVQMNLIKMVNNELQIEVRSVVTKAIKNSETIKSAIKRFRLYDKEYFVRITAKPLIYSKNTEELYVVIFERLDIEDYVSTTKEFDESDSDDVRLQELEHELSATREHLQTYIEEIETGNEELQSLNEELHSTNEELQSSNEELETANEELQSANLEVQVAYNELKKPITNLKRKKSCSKLKNTIKVRFSIIHYRGFSWLTGPIKLQLLMRKLKKSQKNLEKEY